jgi:hypothetical protein
MTAKWAASQADIRQFTCEWVPPLARYCVYLMPVLVGAACFTVFVGSI